MNLDTIKGAGASATSTSGQGRQWQKPWKVRERSDDDKTAEERSSLEDSGIQLYRSGRLGYASRGTEVTCTWHPQHPMTAWHGPLTSTSH